MPPNPVSNQNQSKTKFDSWKEISIYLDRHITTCQRWEKEFGLPVYRLDGSPRARVFAFKDEIDIWHNKIKSESKRNPLRQSFKFLKKSFKFLFMMIFVSTTIALLLSTLIKPPSKAADFNIQNSKLIIRDERQKDMWSYETEITDLQSEEHYRIHFQKKRIIGEIVYFPYIVFKDINGDHHQEILFTPKSNGNFREDRLMCFDEKGEILWNFNVGGKKIFGGETYSDDYKIIGFDVVDIDNRENPEIIIISNHKSSFPSQVVILNSEGNVIGQYWNSGHIMDCVFSDLNNDGINEIILSGINEEWNKPCCIILDYSCIDGVSPQTLDYYKCIDVFPHREKYYFVMPINAVDSIIGKNRCIEQIEINKNTPDEFIKFKSLLTYTFNNEMEH
ncbi:MAG: hypothetical protein MUP98_17790, partial [Candidatus Aminicenantes bacterium]|nr:hypothetical protein [Candidatus Aminicenantes bacterium]